MPNFFDIPNDIFRFNLMVMKFNGTSWEPVGSSPISPDEADYSSLATYNGTLFVSYKDNGNNYKATVKKYAIPVAPEINVKQGTTSIADGTGTYDFGNQTTTSYTDINFTIQNIGVDASTLSSFTITGADAGQFSFQGTNPTTVANGSSVTFTVRFSPVSAGTKTATVSFANQDADENPFNFTITGTGTASPTITSFTPTSAATGETVTITGTNFTGATAVSFGGTAATSFIVVNATTITAVVASGTTGTISVVTSSGTATSLGSFTYVPTYTISGNAGIAGATLSYSDGSAKTATSDGSGNYSFTVSENWTGTVTISRTGCTFTPASKDYINVTSNQAICR